MFFCLFLFKSKNPDKLKKKNRVTAHLFWSSEVNRNKRVVFRYSNSGYLKGTDLFRVSQRAEKDD